MKTKSFDLRTEENAGNRDPLNTRYFIDNRRVTREAFDSIDRDPRAVKSCIANANVNGRQIFYSVVTLPA